MDILDIIEPNDTLIAILVSNELENWAQRTRNILFKFPLYIVVYAMSRIHRESS